MQFKPLDYLIIASLGILLCLSLFNLSNADARYVPKSEIIGMNAIIKQCETNPMIESLTHQRNNLVKYRWQVSEDKMDAIIIRLKERDKFEKIIVDKTMLTEHWWQEPIIWCLFSFVGGYVLRGQ